MWQFFKKKIDIIIYLDRIKKWVLHTKMKAGWRNTAPLPYGHPEFESIFLEWHALINSAQFGQEVNKYIFISCWL